MNFQKNIDDLSWYKDTATQTKAIEYLSNRNELDLEKLVLPIAKSYWENASIVLCSYCDDKLVEILPELLVWLQDINWPGALRINNRISLIDKSKTMSCILDTMNEAVQLNDEMWICSLTKLIDEIEKRSQ